MVIHLSRFDNALVQSPRIVRDYLAETGDYVDKDCAEEMAGVYDELMDMLCAVHDFDVVRKIKATESVKHRSNCRTASSLSYLQDSGDNLHEHHVCIPKSHNGHSRSNSDRSTDGGSQYSQGDRDPFEHVPEPLFTGRRRAITYNSESQSSWKTVGSEDSGNANAEDFDHTLYAMTKTNFGASHPLTFSSDVSQSLEMHPAYGHEDTVRTVTTSGLALAKDKWVERNHFPERRSSLIACKRGKGPVTPLTPIKSMKCSSSGIQKQNTPRQAQHAVVFGEQQFSHNNVDLSGDLAIKISEVDTTTANLLERESTVSCMSPAPSLTRSSTNFSSSPSIPRTPRTPRSPFTKVWEPPVYSPKPESRIEGYHQQLAQSPVYRNHLSYSASTKRSTFKSSRELDGAVRQVDEAEEQDALDQLVQFRRSYEENPFFSPMEKQKLRGVGDMRFEAPLRIDHHLILPRRMRSEPQSMYSAELIKPSPISLNSPSGRNNDSWFDSMLRPIDSKSFARHPPSDLISSLENPKLMPRHLLSAPLPQLPSLDFMNASVADAGHTFSTVIGAMKADDKDAAKGVERRLDSIPQAQSSLTSLTSLFNLHNVPEKEHHRDFQAAMRPQPAANLPQPYPIRLDKLVVEDTEDSFKTVKFINIRDSQMESLTPPSTPSKIQKRSNIRKVASMTADHLHKRFSVCRDSDSSASLARSLIGLSNIPIKVGPTTDAYATKRAESSIQGLMQTGLSEKALKVLGGMHEVERWEKRLQRKEKQKTVHDERKLKADNAAEIVSRLLAFG